MVMKTFFLAALVLLQPAVSSAVLISYQHDVAGRLTTVNYNGASRTQYAYDKNGSLLSRINSVTPPTAAAAQMAGTYNGLVTHPSSTAGNTGIISLKILANGTFSGKVTIRGAAYGFSGKFLPNGSLEGMHIIINRKAPLLDYLLSLTLDVTGSIPSISGTLTGDFNSVVFNSQISMNPDVFNTGGQMIGNGLVGKYTLLLHPAFGLGAPKGIGYATIVVNNKGALTMAGKLANNVAITQGTQIVGQNIWPLYVALHANQGYVAGNLKFYSLDFPGLDIGGFVSWLKPVTTGTFHPTGFATVLNAAGSLYLPPAAGQRIIDLAPVSPNAVFSASDGNLAAPFNRNITIDAANKLIVQTVPPPPGVDPRVLKLTLSVSNGFINGTFKDGTVTRTMSGVFHQELNYGAGFFPGSTQSGKFEIEAPPPP